MTPHADRDRSEPYWPPAATREPRVRFPLDDGDTGASLLPVAPAGTLLRCPVCPAALADTRGGRLGHCDDGSHHYVPEADAEAIAERRRRYATALDLHSFALASTYWQRFVLRVMAVADAEQAELRAEVERLREFKEAWRDEWHKENIARLAAERALERVEAVMRCAPKHCRCGGDRPSVPTSEIRAALDGPTPGAAP